MDGGQRRWGALDGLRGVAVLMVVVAHAGITDAPLGVAGVSIFFVLSGFLITKVIVAARERGEWSLRSFLVARVVRLAPALLVMQAVILIWSLLVDGLWSSAVLGQALATSLYVENFFHDPTAAPLLFDHAWSLAVEEQFYLLWPLVLPLVVRVRRPVLVIGAAAAVSIAVRLFIALSDSWVTDYVGSASLPANAFGLLLGCLLAIDPPTVRAGRVQRVVPLVGLAAIVAASVYFAGNPSAGVVLLPIVVAMVAPVVVATALPGCPLLELRWLRFVGRISYALYLWHYPLLVLVGAEGPRMVLALALSGVLAVASTLLVEEPLRRRWRARRAAVTPSPHPVRA